MAIKLGDDGTLDTVLFCAECRAEFRYNFDPDASESEASEDDGKDAYDEFVKWAIEDATENHVCGANGGRLAMAKQTVAEKTPGLEITLHAEREDDDPGGHFASDDDAADKAMVDSIIARSNNGDVWAWCFVRVTATYRGVSVSDTLGACSYESEQDFRDGGYYADMVYEVLKQLNAQLEAIDACDLAPHNRAILACACGYKRTNGNGR